MIVKHQVVPVCVVVKFQGVMCGREAVKQQCVMCGSNPALCFL